MKAKLFLSVLLLMGFTQLSAQNQQNGNGSSSYDVVWPIYLLVEDNGTVLAELTGVIQYHVVEHYVNFELEWLKASCHGEFVDEATGETFWVNELDKSIIDFGVWTGDFWVLDNVIGSNGTHYILKTLWNYTDYSITTLSLVIPGQE